MPVSVPCFVSSLGGGEGSAAQPRGWLGSSPGLTALPSPAQILGGQGEKGKGKLKINKSAPEPGHPRLTEGARTCPGARSTKRRGKSKALGFQLPQGDENPHQNALCPQNIGAVSISREGKVHRRPGRWLLACYTEQGRRLLPRDAFPEPHTALGLVPGAAQQENPLSLPGYRRGARPCPPRPSAAPSREPVPAESGRKERRTVACTFNDFNCQVFSTSGWKIVIRAPRTGVSPAGSMRALANAGTGAALPGDTGTCRVAGAPRSHPHWG